MPCPQLHLDITASPYTPTHAGAAKLVPPFHPVPRLKCISSGHCPDILSFAVAVPLNGQLFDRSTLANPYVRQKFAPQMNAPRKSC